ncbi:hypothetical protein D3C85_1190420 [compost metagenome]
MHALGEQQGRYHGHNGTGQDADQNQGRMFLEYFIVFEQRYGKGNRCRLQHAAKPFPSAVVGFIRNMNEQKPGDQDQRRHKQWR